jgi:RNA polymerase sigma-70 factor (ECF subfamily)
MKLREPEPASESMSEDEVLVRRFQRGEEAAFDELVDRHRRRVFALACRLVGELEADDLAQEVFLAAYRSLATFRGDSSFSTWLYRITVHICSHHLRRRRLPTTDLEEEYADARSDHDPVRVVLRGELKERVRQAIDALPYKLRLVLVLRDMHGLSYEEIAQVARIPIGTVRSRLHNASSKLATHLEQYVELRA